MIKIKGLMNEKVDLVEIMVVGWKGMGLVMKFL